MKQTFYKFLFCSFAFSVAVFAKENHNFLERNLPKNNVLHSKKMEKEEMKTVALYIKPTCPYCVKVLNKLKEIEKQVEIKDISSDSALRDELIAIGGKKQVPCIVIDRKAKYESAEIITWLIQNKDLL